MDAVGAVDACGDRWVLWRLSILLLVFLTRIPTPCEGGAERYANVASVMQTAVKDG